MNLTAFKLLAGLSLGSLKPKSEVLSVYGVLSGEKTVVGVPTGALFGTAKLKSILTGFGSRSIPPFAVPPSS